MPWLQERLMRIQWKKQASNEAIIYLCTMQLILNDIGTWEVLLILAFALMFFGSKSIPGLARTAGKTIRQVREASSDIQNEIRKSSNDMKNDLNLKELISDTAEDIKRPLDQYASDLDDAVKYQPPRRPSVAKPPGHPERMETEKPEVENNSEDSIETKSTETNVQSENPDSKETKT